MHKFVNVVLIVQLKFQLFHGIIIIIIIIIIVAEYVVSYKNTNHQQMHKRALS
jgi:hypothetical protein